MVKMFIRPLILLVIVYAAGGYIYYLGTGNAPLPKFSFPGLSVVNQKPDLRRLSEMPMLNSIDAEIDKATIYKWQDENGVWNISNQPPDSNSEKDKR